MRFLADQIEQMDLAVDQLALKDRNFDRLALLLIDNVIELTLHEFAQDRLMFTLQPVEESRQPKKRHPALGQYFDDKVKFANNESFLANNVAQSIISLHRFRNTAHHRGLRHEGILHSLCLFYFKLACEVAAAYSPLLWHVLPPRQIPHRALKYLGEAGLPVDKTRFRDAWQRLRLVPTSVMVAITPPVGERSPP